MRIFLLNLVCSSYGRTEENNSDKHFLVTFYYFYYICIVINQISKSDII